MSRVSPQADVKVGPLKLEGWLWIYVKATVEYDPNDGDVLGYPDIQIELDRFPKDWNDDTDAQHQARLSQIQETYEGPITEALDEAFYAA